MSAPGHPFWWAGLWLGLVIVLGAFPRQPALAQAGDQITSNQATVAFPHRVSFRLEGFNAPALETVILHYGTEARSCQPTEAQQSLDIQPGTTFRARWDWELARSGALPHGTEIWWQWELRYPDGSSQRTERRTMTFDDSRHEWRSLHQGGLSVHWFAGDQAFGASLLTIAARGLARLEAFSGLDPGQPIRLVVYPSPEEVREALIHTYEWTGGIALPEYHTAIVGIRPGEMAWARSVIPHELSHLVIGELVFNCHGARLPTWLGEGLAEYAEGTTTTDRSVRVEAALEADNLPPLVSLSRGFSAYSEAASLSYAYSAMVVDFMIAEYGPDSMRELLDQLRAGRSFERALEAVYGLDTRGLDRTWRSAQGFASPAPGETPAGSPSPPTSIPTLALWTPIPGVTSTVAPPIETRTPFPPAPTLASPPPGSSGNEMTKEGRPGASQTDATASVWIIALGAGAGVLLAIVLVKLRKDESS